MPTRERVAWFVLVIVATLYLREIFGPGPTPGPGPLPPDPDPEPTPTAPFQVPTDGLYVLFVEETTERPKLPPEQLLIFTAAELRQWLDAHAKGQWRLLDQNAPTNNDEKVWQDAMKVPRQSLPWIAISNGKTGYSGPLPPNTKAVIELLDKYKTLGANNGRQTSKHRLQPGLLRRVEARPIAARHLQLGWRSESWRRSNERFLLRRFHWRQSRNLDCGREKRNAGSGSGGLV